MKKDKIVQQVIAKFEQRSEVGIKKYGTTLEENNTDDFLDHLQMELMDGILYLEKLKTLKKNTGYYGCKDFTMGQRKKSSSRRSAQAIYQAG